MLEVRTVMQRDEAIPLTTPPHNLEDFERYAQAAAKVAELRRQKDDLGARLLIAERRMREICFGRVIPPRDADREVNEINQRIEAIKAEVADADRALRSAASEAATAISKAAKPEHDKLRARVIGALRELRDALDQERHFRADLDRRDVGYGGIIRPATIPELTQPGKLEAWIKNLEGF